MGKHIFKFKQFPTNKVVHGIFDKTWGNISLHHGQKNQVLLHKKNIAKSLDIDWQKIYSLNQVHGSQIKIIKKEKNSAKEEDGDVLVSNVPNAFLLIKTADCFPVLMFDPQHNVVAAVHVGWRGAIEKIFLVALLKMINHFRCKPKDILVGFGPAIGPCCFKHKKLIQEKLPEWQRYMKQNKGGWKSLDWASFIKDQLINSGVKKAHMETMNICTGCDQRFFSHWRSLRTKEPEGRFASIIGLKG
jgi:YfiH family protein